MKKLFLLAFAGVIGFGSIAFAENSETVIDSTTITYTVDLKQTDFNGAGANQFSLSIQLVYDSATSSKKLKVATDYTYRDADAWGADLPEGTSVVDFYVIYSKTYPEDSASSGKSGRKAATLQALWNIGHDANLSAERIYLDLILSKYKIMLTTNNTSDPRLVEIEDRLAITSFLIKEKQFDLVRRLDRIGK